MLRTVIASTGYLLIVFPLALVWHSVLFPDLYNDFGYFEGEPNIAVGFLTILIQGIALAVIFRFFMPVSSGFGRALTYVALMGLFFWTSHVLALIAKQNVPNAMQFAAMETAYLVLQFGLFGLVLGAVYRRVP